MRVRCKPDVTVTDIERMVADCFGAGTRIEKPVELLGGQFNVAYSIRLPDKNIETVLRIAPAPELHLLTYERDLMRTEVAVYELLRQRTSIPLPQIYGTNFRRDIFPSDFMFLRQMRGVTLRSIKETLPEEAWQPPSYELGKCMAQIHAIQGDYFGYFANPIPPFHRTWKTAFLRMVETLLADGQALQVSLPRSYEAIFALFEQSAAALEEIEQPHLVHGDLWDANVFVIQSPEGQWQLEGIIDCDRALWGDPDAEYSLLFKDSRDRFFQGYSRTLSDTRAARCRRAMYRAYLYLIVNIEATVRFAAADHPPAIDSILENTFQELQQFSH